MDDGVHGDDGEREGDDYVEEDDDDQLDHHQHFEEDGVVPHFGFLLVRGDSFSFCGFLVAKKKNAHPRGHAYYYSADGGGLCRLLLPPPRHLPVNWWYYSTLSWL